MTGAKLPEGKYHDNLLYEYLEKLFRGDTTTEKWGGRSKQYHNMRGTTNRAGIAPD